MFREEWMMLKLFREHQNSANVSSTGHHHHGGRKKHPISTSSNSPIDFSASQLIFQDLLTTAAETLLRQLGVVSPAKLSASQIYAQEVIEVSDEVSLIVLLPPPSDICSAPGQHRRHSDERTGCRTMPVNLFEYGDFCIIFIISTAILQ